MATYLPGESGIYQIVNLVSQKRYIGLASNMKTRMNGHLYDLRRGIHANAYLQKAWNKYGSKAFTFKCLEKCAVSSLHLREDYWVRVLKVDQRYYGYNIKPTNPEGCSQHSEETKFKISRDHKFKGIKPGILCLKKRQELGVTERQRIAMRESLKKVNFSKVHREKRGKKVINVKTQEVYSSLAEVAELLDVHKGSLSRKLSGKRNNNTHYKYL